MKSNDLNIEKNTFSWGPIVKPLPNIDISVSMYKSTISKGDIVLPIAFVDRPIFPLLNSPSISFIIFPLPLIDISFLKLQRTHFLSIFYLEVSSVVLEHSELLFFLPYYFIRKIWHRFKFDSEASHFLVSASLVDLRGEDRNFFPLFPTFALFTLFIIGWSFFSWSIWLLTANFLRSRSWFVFLLYRLYFFQRNVFGLAGWASFSHLLYYFLFRSKIYCSYN